MSFDWGFLTDSPLLWLTVTIAVFLFADFVNKKCSGSPLAHPVIISLTIIIFILTVSGVEYQPYSEGTSFLQFLMGPAVVAIAVPLYDNLARVRSMFIPLCISCMTAAVVAALSALMVAWALGADLVTLLSLAPKSVTSPIAIGIADKVGGYGSLAAGLVLITGAMGCLMAPTLFKLLKIDDSAVRGFALGVSAHAMGTAYAFEYGAMAGAFSGLAMGMTGTFTAFFLPVLIEVLPFLH